MTKDRKGDTYWIVRHYDHSRYRGTITHHKTLRTQEEVKKLCENFERTNKQYEVLFVEVQRTHERKNNENN